MSTLFIPIYTGKLCFPALFIPDWGEGQWKCLLFSKQFVPSSDEIETKKI